MGNSERTSGWPFTRLVDRPVLKPRPLPEPRAGEGEGEHHPAGSVQVAGEGGHEVRRPRGDGAEGHGVRTDAAVDHGGLGGGDLPGEAADGVGVDAGVLGDGLGRERLDHGTQGIESAEHGRVELGHQVLGEEHVHHGQEQVAVGAGADGHVLVGVLGGLGEAGVDHHDLAARSRMASRRPGKSGAVQRLPFDSYGLAPSMSR